MQELQGKNVMVSLDFTNLDNVVKGEVVEISDTWLKIKTKKRLEFIRVGAIVKIAVSL